MAIAGLQIKLSSSEFSAPIHIIFWSGIPAATGAKMCCVTEGKWVYGTLYEQWALEQQLMERLRAALQVRKAPKINNLRVERHRRGRYRLMLTNVNSRLTLSSSKRGSAIVNCYVSGIFSNFIPFISSRSAWISLQNVMPPPQMIIEFSKITWLYYSYEVLNGN